MRILFARLASMPAMNLPSRQAAPVEQKSHPYLSSKEFSPSPKDSPMKARHNEWLPFRGSASIG
jgi:hypothetical protein